MTDKKSTQNNNLAFALPENLSQKVKDLQKQLGLNTPGEVILKALSLLELSIGREVQMKDGKETLQIQGFKNYRQSITLEDIEEKTE